MRPAIHFDHGQPGERIAGSAYFRGYCRFCGDPLRCPSQDQARRGWAECDECRALCRNERGRQRGSRGGTD